MTFFTSLGNVLKNAKSNFQRLGERVKDGWNGFSSMGQKVGHTIKNGADFVKKHTEGIAFLNDVNEMAGDVSNMAGVGTNVLQQIDNQVNSLERKPPKKHNN